MVWEPKTAQPDTGWMPKTAQPDETASPQKDDSLSGKIGAAWHQRAQERPTIFRDSTGDMTEMSHVRDLAHKVGYVGDMGSAAIGYAAENAPKQVKDVTSAIGGYLGDSPVGDAVIAAGDKTKELAKNHPLAAENAKAVLDLASAVPTGLLAKGAEDVAGEAISKGVEKSAARKATDLAAQRTSEDVKSEAQEAYAMAESKGGSLKPEWTNKALDELGELRTQTEAGKAIEGDTPLNKLLDRAEALRGKPLSLQGAQEVDKALTNEISTHFKDGKLDAHGQQIMDFQNKFRDMIDGAGSHEVNGGKEGFDALNQARSKWSQAARMRDLEKIMERVSDNPKATKNGFMALYNNKARLSKFTAEEQAAIKKAATTGLRTDLLHLLSNKGITIVHAATGGGLGSSALSYGGNRLAGSAEEAMHRRRGQKVIDMVAGRKTAPDVDSALGATKEPLMLPAPATYVDKAGNAGTHGPSKALPAPKAQTVVGENGVVRSEYPAERDATIVRRQQIEKLDAAQAARDKELGISPDIRKAIKTRMDNDAWKDLTDRQQEMVAQQMQKAWAGHKNSIEDVIKAAKDYSESVAKAKGEKPPSGPMSAIYSAKTGR